MLESIDTNAQTEAVSDVADHAITLLDCADDIGTAIEENYRAAEMLRRRYAAGESADPREVLIAFGGLKALLKQALHKVEAQEESLERLGFAIVRRPQTPRSGVDLYRMNVLEEE